MSKASGSENKNTLFCSFCGKSLHEVRKMIAGPTVFICDECVELCMDIIREENKSSLVKSKDGVPTPHEVRKRMRLLSERDAYRDRLAIFERLAARDPDNTEWQRDLSVSFEMIGVLERAQCDLAAALKSYRDSLAIRERLVARDPGNAEWQRDLSVLFDKIGDIEWAQDDFPAALASDRASLAIRQRLAARDPGNTQWQQDLINSYVYISGVATNASDIRSAIDGALAMQTKGLLAPFGSWIIDYLRDKLTSLEAAAK